MAFILHEAKRLSDSIASGLHTVIPFRCFGQFVFLFCFNSTAESMLCIWMDATLVFNQTSADVLSSAFHLLTHTPLDRWLSIDGL